MFKKIGTGETGKPLVLCEFNVTEAAAMELILKLTNHRVDSLPMSREHKDIIKLMSNQMAKIFELDVS